MTPQQRTAIAERVAAERIAQGLPATISDPTTLSRLAAIVQPAFTGRPNIQRGAA